MNYIEIPESLKVLPKELLELYQVLVAKCCTEWIAADYCPDSDQSCSSIKVHIGPKREEMFVQFKPRRPHADDPYIKVELHIDMKKLNDPNGICQSVGGDKPHWSYFSLYKEDKEMLAYFFELMRQSYGEVASKSKAV